MGKRIEVVETNIIYILCFLIPLAVVGVFPNIFVTIKLIILVFGVMTLLVLKSIKLFARSSIKLATGTFDFPIFLLIGAYLGSAFLNTPNKMEAFFLPGTATLMTAGGLFYYFLNQADAKVRNFVPTLLYISGVVISLLTLLASAGILKNIGGLPEFVQSNTFNPVGGSLAAVIFTATVLPFGFSYLIKEKDSALKAFWVVTLGLLIFGGLIALIQILPGKANNPNLPDYNTSWVVAVDSLKVSPLLGIGPGNYVTAFSRFRPLTYNQTKLWRVRFATSRSFYLTVLTEAGLVGAVALGLIGLSLYKLIKNDDKAKKLVGWSTKDNVKLVSLVTLVIFLLLFPTNIVFIFLIFTLLSLNAEMNTVNLGNYQTSSDLSSKLPLLVVIVPGLILTSATIYYGRQAVLSEYYYKKALDAVASNQAGVAYDLFQKSISTNPYSDRYHVSYAQINLALANSISQNKDLSDQDRQTIAQLIDRTIREGQATVALNPQRSANWELLAKIYQTITPLSSEAQQYAVESYRQAIALDPINPDLRIALGNVYYANKDYDNAIRALELAISAKPDYANAHYNLAFALRENGNLDEAISEMSTVVSLVDRNSNDYKLAKDALAELQNKKGESQESEQSISGESLVTPQSPGEPLNPQIELSEGSEPPQPSPEATPAASPTPLP